MLQTLDVPGWPLIANILSDYVSSTRFPGDILSVSSAREYIAGDCLMGSMDLEEPILAATVLARVHLRPLTQKGQV